MSFKDKLIDLHIHSTTSDGTWEPSEITEVVKKNQVGVFSITDHDSTEAVLIGEELAAQSKLNYIHGVEISSTHKTDWEHILAYGVDLRNENLQQLLQENKEKINKKDKVSVEYLEDNGYVVSTNEFMQYTYDKRRGGFKLLNYLIDKNICKNVGDFFTIFSGMDQVSGFPQYRSVEDVVNVIKKAGGMPILAHPFYTTKDYENIPGRLKPFLNRGIEGIECYHPSHDLKVAQECMAFCKKNNLVMTVGSDCHGDFVPSRRIGMHSIRVGDIEIGRLKDYIV